MSSGKDPYLDFWGMCRDDTRSMMPLVYCIGKITAVSKEHLRVLADGHELDEDDILINAAYQPDFEEEVELTDMSGRLNGASSICPNGFHTYFDVTSVSNDPILTYKAPMRLSVGDFVLLLPDSDRQIYYLMCKVVSWHGAVPANQPT